MVSVNTIYMAKIKQYKKNMLLTILINGCSVLKVEVKLFIINYYLLKMRLSIIIDIKMFYK